MAKGFCIIEKEVELRGWEPSLEEKSQEADRGDKRRGKKITVGHIAFPQNSP